MAMSLPVKATSPPLPMAWYSVKKLRPGLTTRYKPRPANRVWWSSEWHSPSRVVLPPTR